MNKLYISMFWNTLSTPLFDPMQSLAHHAAKVRIEPISDGCCIMFECRLCPNEMINFKKGVGKMISHIHIGTSNLLRAVEFYDAVLDPLNIKRKFVDEESGWAGWKSKAAERPLFLVGQPFNGARSSAGNGSMVALLSPSRLTVDLCYDLALQAGATDEGKPGLRPKYHADYYGAYFRDLDDNKICICCHAAG